MPKNKHHYVPQFYLRAFSSNPPQQTQIHLYNLERRRAISSVSLKDQCYKHHLHGKTDHIEDALGKLEGYLAPVLQEIIATSELPTRKSIEHGRLYTFVALQILRTARVGEQVNSGIDKFFKEAFRNDSRLKDIDLDLVRLGFENPVLASLRMLPGMMNSIADLEMHLLCADEDQVFITSDNPVYKYNQYMEGIRGMGFTGGLSTGLQLFVPLSPKHLLMLYDAGVYRVGTWKNPLVTMKLANSDVTKLNSLQVHTADENLYFNDWSDEKFVEYIVRRSVGQRIADPTRVDEYVDPDNELHSMLHRYDLMPNLMLRLSFVTVQEKAKRIPMRIRILPTHNVRRNNGEIVPELPSGPLIPNGTLFVPRNRLPQSQSGRKKQR